MKIQVARISEKTGDDKRKKQDKRREEKKIKDN